MARRKNNSNDPREKLYNCADGNCKAQLKNSEFPQHYLNAHNSNTGRYECNASGCEFLCSNSDICIHNHIDEEHDGENVEASFNPFKKTDFPRIKDRCTDQCGDEKVKVKGKRKVFRKVNQESDKAVVETVTISMNSRSRAAIGEGTMNSQAQNAVRVKKARVANNENKQSSS